MILSVHPDEDDGSGENTAHVRDPPSSGEGSARGPLLDGVERDRGGRKDDVVVLGHGSGSSVGVQPDLA